jgi:hypothetical protein
LYAGIYYLPTINAGIAQGRKVTGNIFFVRNKTRQSINETSEMTMTCNNKRDKSISHFHKDGWRFILPAITAGDSVVAAQLSLVTVKAGRTAAIQHYPLPKN